MRLQSLHEILRLCRPTLSGERRGSFASSLFLACFVCLTSTARSEWTTFATVDGLGDAHVQAVIEDRLGNLWFGTNGGGVSRYDGVSWRTYTSVDGLADDRVLSICQDSSGDFWFGTRSGVSRYDGRHWTTYTYEDVLSGIRVNAIIEDSSGDMWFGTSQEGLCRYDGSNWTTYHVTDGSAGFIVTAILEDSLGDIWLGTTSGVRRYDGVEWTEYLTPGGLASPIIWAICEDGSGRLWFGTGDDGVVSYDREDWTIYSPNDGFAHDRVNAIAEDHSGDLWFAGGDPWLAGRGGVSRYNGSNWRVYTKSDGLAGDDVYAMIEHSSGDLWFGTVFGASRYDRVDWRHYTAEDGLAQTFIKAIAVDHSGGLWFGTNAAGVSHYDGVDWRTYSESDGLVSSFVNDLVYDRAENLWVATWAGVSRYDGVSWTSYTSTDGLASSYVYTIFEDASGNIWFGTRLGASRFDGSGWATFNTEDGLAADHVHAICEDGSGDMWFGTLNGASRYDGVEWTTYRESDVLADDRVNVILMDSSGSMWLGTAGGISQFDGDTWTAYTTADGLADNDVYAIVEDRWGILWFGSDAGATRHDGVGWASYTEADGLKAGAIADICEDNSGNLWFGGGGGATYHEPDRYAPQTVIWPNPPVLTASTNQTIVFEAAYGETRGVRFSHSLDGAAWSEWSVLKSWTGNNIPDGEHSFRVRARDRAGNVDSSAAVAVFEVDATPPVPVISSPFSGQALRDSVQIQGTAADLRFKSYVIDMRHVDGSAWEYLTGSCSSIYDGVLGGWNTTSMPDGDYELRLSVTDTLGLTGAAIVRVVVDNEAPWAYETSPAVIKYGDGGDVYTTNREVHLYFPPNGFAQDTEVRIERPANADVPDTLSDGAVRMHVGYEISWGDSVLAKPATLELSYEGTEFERDSGPGAYPEESTFAIYMMDSDSEWCKLGGTVDTDANTISTTLTEPGQYSIFAGGHVAVGRTALSAFSITPRVFSPSGGFAAARAAIGFTLGRPGPVTVKIYNRAGRLVSEVVVGEQLNAGANMVHWDGRGRGGELVEDGVYLVTVEALGQKQVKPLAVVR